MYLLRQFRKTRTSIPTLASAALPLKRTHAADVHMHASIICTRL